MRSKKQLLKKGGGIQNEIIQATLYFSDDGSISNVKIDEPTARKTILNLEKPKPLKEIIPDLFKLISPQSTLDIKKFIRDLHDPKNEEPVEETIFNDITDIVKTFGDKRTKLEVPHKLNNDYINFQSNQYYIDEKYTDLFGKYKIFNKENSRKFVTIDPTIVQIMVFDADVNNMDNDKDIVYSLKLIIRDKNELTLRYTTQLFPSNSKITNFKDLSYFGAFNKSLGNNRIKTDYDKELSKFLKKYIKFYDFYKKCYTIQTCEGTETNKKLIDYQLKYISILGKARFGDEDIQKRTSLLTDYVMSNLIFASPSYAFISGGYKGFKESKYGITRSGYEIAKKYNRPILTIMCAEGLHDSHDYSDAQLIYGEHWGEDSIALSQLTDGAIVISPFGGWTYIECLTLLANKKIVVIYNDFFNILNYEETSTYTPAQNAELREIIKKELPLITKETEISDLIERNKNKKSDNINFFKFNFTEQNNIIDLYINYYLILYYILLDDTIILHDDTDKDEFKNCLHFGIKILMHLKTLLSTESKNLQKTINILTDVFKLLIETFNSLKKAINDDVGKNLEHINNIYRSKCDKTEYQNLIPKKCDGIWIKPLFSLIDDCIEKPPKTGGYRSKKGGRCDIGETLVAQLEKYSIKVKELKAHQFFTNLNNNIIFVFSDVMYLNLYLNTNLNTTFFQEKIHNKINDLSTITTGGFASTKKLLDDENQKYVDLNRDIDGMFNTELGQIVNNNIIREKYSFIISNACNDYSSILTEIPIPNLSQKSDKPMMIGQIGKKR
jgi:hypothetical protein